MRFRDPIREITEGSVRAMTFDLAPAIGSNTVTGTPTIEADGLTLASTAISGTVVSTLVSGGVADTDYIVTITTILSSGETDVGAIKLEWKAPGYEARSAS